MVFSMAGAVWLDKDEHMSCAAAKLPEGHMCCKQMGFFCKFKGSRRTYYLMLSKGIATGIVVEFTTVCLVTGAGRP